MAAGLYPKAFCAPVIEDAERTGLDGPSFEPLSAP